jgi:deoxyadenosine/deoxycytidine kinase
MEYAIYTLLYNENIAQYSVDGIIYISTNPDKCYERVQKRNREGESNIEMDYLVKCDKYHMDWLLDDHVDNDSHVLALDTSKDIDILNPKQYQLWVNQISSFIDDVKKSKMKKEKA